MRRGMIARDVTLDYILQMRDLLFVEVEIVVKENDARRRL